MKRKIALVVLTLFLAVSTIVSATVPVAEAPPRFPSSFYGTVTLDMEPVPSGTTIEAYINGVRYAQAITSTSDGQSVYSINVPQDDPMTSGLEGGHQNDTITFIVGGRYTAAQRGVYRIGQNTALNLTASTVAPTPTPIPTPTPRPSPTATPTPAPTVSVPLYAGWNAIAYSGPVQDVGVALASVIAGQTVGDLAVNVTIVYHYNNQTKAWESYDPALPPFANSLTQFQPGEAYWISVRSNLTLRLASGAPPSVVPLYAGWNMTTYFGESQPVADILAGALPEATAIYAFNNQSKGWSSYLSDLPPFVNSLTNMSTGTAFWVYVPRTIAWSWFARGTPGDNATVSKEFYLGYTRLCITFTSGGTPVQGAEAWVQDDLGNDYLGTTDASGTFCVNLPRGIRTVKYHIQWKDSSGKWHVVYDWDVDP